MGDPDPRHSSSQQTADRVWTVRATAGKGGAASTEHPKACTGFAADVPTVIVPGDQLEVDGAYLTGWRVKSEVLTLEWRQVDFAAGEVRLEPNTTKNKEGRTFPFTKGLRALLESQHQEHKRLTKRGYVVPWVFFRMVADERRGEKKPRRIVSFIKAFKTACRRAGCPGRIPHDLRRTAVRNLERAGVPRSVAMKLTGHKTESVYRRYAIADDRDLRVAVERLEAASNL